MYFGLSNNCEIEKAQSKRLYGAESELARVTKRTSSTKIILTTMAPPKLGALNQAYRKPRSNLRAPQQPQGREQEPAKTVEFVNLDEIHSPNMEPASPTPVVEET